MADDQPCFYVKREMLAGGRRYVRSGGMFHTHHSLEEASREAMRLAGLHRGVRFVILQTVGSVCLERETDQ